MSFDMNAPYEGAEAPTDTQFKRYLRKRKAYNIQKLLVVNYFCSNIPAYWVFSLNSYAFLEITTIKDVEN